MIDIEHRLTAVEDRSKSNTNRLDKLEKSTEAINRLAVSVEGIATKQDGMVKTLNKLDGKVETLESKPAKRWDTLVDKIIWAICAAVIAFLLGRIGL